MPFYSRHSSDGRDRFLGDIQDEEEYDQFMKMIFISSNFTDEIQVHYIMIVQKQMSYRLQAAKKKRLKRQKKNQKEYHSKYYKEKMQKPYTCKFCGKTISDSSNTKRHKKSKRCREAKTNV